MPHDIEFGDIHHNDGNLYTIAISYNGNVKNKRSSGSNVIWFENKIK